MQKFLGAFLLLIIIGKTNCLLAQSNQTEKIFTHADTLRGSLSSARNWWDVQRYKILVEPDYTNKTISGKVDILFNTIGTYDTMQIDLQSPMQLNKGRSIEITLK